MKFFGRNKKNSIDNLSMQKGVKMLTISEPLSVNNEQFNTIRTNIQFSNIDVELKSIMFTSSTMSEGKSTIAANVATSFSKQGLKVLLVDADLRRPTIKSTFKMAANTMGITSYLSNKDIDLKDMIFRTSVHNLFIMPSGPVPPNPSELIGSKKMVKMMGILSSNFDLVIYDAPPVLSVTDGQILSTKVDGTVFVVRKGLTEKESVRESIEMIKKVKGHIIGVILNDVEQDSSGYYGYYK